MTTRRLRILLVLLLTTLVGCDFATKQAARTSLRASGAIEIVPRLFELRYTENHDTAFSLLQRFESPSKAKLLTLFALLASAGIVAAWWSLRRAPLIVHVSFAMLLAGGIGNAIDRARLGYVVDFLHVTRWPVFNVADIAVTVGAMLLGLHLFRRRARAAPT